MVGHSFCSGPLPHQMRAQHKHAVGISDIQASLALIYDQSEGLAWSSCQCKARTRVCTLQELSILLLSLPMGAAAAHALVRLEDTFDIPCRRTTAKASRQHIHCARSMETFPLRKKMPSLSTHFLNSAVGCSCGASRRHWQASPRARPDRPPPRQKPVHPSHPMAISLVSKCLFRAPFPFHM